MKREGFTLIELLAVIVVLAIIALIAVPMVLNTIEEARKGAAKASALTYVSEVEKYIVSSQLDSSKVKLVPGETYQVNNTEENGISLNDLVDNKGDLPTIGAITIGEGYKVESANLIIDNYELKCVSQTCEVVSKGTSILEKVKALVYAADGTTCKIDADENDTTTYKYMGGCYIKGASANNYVWYNGFMWRIMGINSDNTVRLITDDNATALPYGTTTSYKENQGKGYIHDWLNEYFYKHLNSSRYIIREGEYFCSESSEGVKYTGGRKNCTEGNTINAKVGIIAMDEYELATATSYLNNKQVFWTMTPFSDTHVAYIATGGINWKDQKYEDNGKPLGPYGVRPVINVDPNSIVTAGNGEVNNFFVLGENKNNDVKGKLSNAVTSGEYVSLEGKTYRVVSKNDTGVKLILDGFYEESDSEGSKKTTFIFGDNNTFTRESGIGAKLNGIEGDEGENVITWLGLSNSDKIIEAIYYQGDGFDTAAGYPYTTTLKESNGIQAKVGLIQIGDILATQSSTMLTKNYTTANNINNTKTYWTMNKRPQATMMWDILANGNGSRKESTLELAIRPVITVRSDLDITSGNGTWNNPYQV